jgi:hypothetical protein
VNSETSGRAAQSTCGIMSPLHVREFFVGGVPVSFPNRACLSHCVVSGTIGPCYRVYPPDWAPWLLV